MRTNTEAARTAAGGQWAALVNAIRTVWDLAGSHRVPLLWGLALRVPHVLCSAAQVMLVALAIEKVRTGQLTASVAWALGSLIIASVAIQLVFALASNRFLWLNCYRFGGDLRVRLLEHTRQLPLSFHSRRQVGDTAMVLTADVTVVEDFVGWTLPSLFGDIVQPIAVLVVLALVDPAMAVIVAVSVAAAIPALGWTQRRYARFTAGYRDLQGQAVARIVEYVQGIAVVRSFNLIGARQRSLRAALDDLHALLSRLLRMVTPTYVVFTTVLQLGIALTIAAAAYWMFNGRIDSGTAIVFLVLAVRVYEPLFDIATRAESVPMVTAALRRSVAVLDAPAQPFPAEPRRLSRFDLAFDGVCFAYEKDDGLEPALVDVSFAVPERTMTAIVGPSGAGKSTVLNLLARLYDPDTGTVAIGGVDVRDIAERQLYATVSMALQDTYLFSGTIRENIAAGRPDASLAEIEAAARTAGCHDDITALPAGYDTLVGEAGHTLSGGERQRVTLARAILKNAPVLLLDEVTAAVDPSTERAVTEAIETLRAGTTTTIVVVTHRLATIRSADQILVLDGGRIVEAGTHTELVAAGGLYARLTADRERAQGWRIGAAAGQPSHLR